MPTTLVPIQNLESLPKPRRKPTGRQKLLLMAGALVCCILLLLVGEAFCRLFLDIQLQGNSAELFAGKVFGESMGHARNATGISFGVDVWTDSNGFRVPFNHPQKTSNSALLILGDSVGFGCGVEEEKTFAGLMRKELADTTVYNSSVIGYALPDYKNVVELFLPQLPEVKKVYLSFCVNDISHVSASNIKDFLYGAPDGDTIGKIKLLPVIHDVIAYLRSRSKLYIGLKNLLTNPAQRYFYNDLALYAVNDQTFEEIMQPALDIERELEDRGIEFTVVLAPSEPQLRSADPAVELPQRRVAEFCRKNGIRCLNPLDWFRHYSGNPSQLYLSGDAMHFSEVGHQYYFDFLRQDFHN
jgi:hypothetical protein